MGGKGSGRRKSSISSTRGFLYSFAKLLGDFDSIGKKRVSKRVGRRVAGKITSRLLGGLFR